jgi:polyisoprenoid-binding protein YceI
MTDTAVTSYAIDTAHSNVEFSVRHLMISKVKGSFDRVTGTLTLGESAIPTSITASIEIDSISTRDEKRDGHLKSDDFFAAATHPTMDFVSTAITPKTAETFEIAGNLTMHGVTRPVVFEATVDGRVTDPWGLDRIAYSASAKLNREDYGMTFNQALEAGGVMVGKDIEIDLTIQAVPASEPGA